nr:hypothetical protein [Vibrio parahaemolyticus]
MAFSLCAGFSVEGGMR